MVATATVSGGKVASMIFDNVGGILRYTVKGDKTIQSITVMGNGLDMTLDCGDGVALTADGTVFNFALPAGTYTDAKLSFLATDGMIATKTAPEFVVSKNKVSLATFEASALPFNVLSDNAPVGSVGMLFGREAIVVDLGGTVGKVAIATQNVGATTSEWNDGGGYYNATDISNPNFLSDGWYVPSTEELSLLSKLPSTWGEYGRSWQSGNGDVLFLPAAGIMMGDQLMPGLKTGAYLSSENDGMYYYSMNFSDESVFIAQNLSLKDFKCSVRPFHKLGDFASLPRLNYESPVGSHGLFNGLEAVIVDLGDGFGKYAVATKNVGADKPCDFGNKYQSSNLPTGTNGWCVPTKEELDALIANYTQTSWTAFNNVPGRQFSIEGTQLFFPAAGEGEQDMYWAKDNGRMTLTESSFATEALTSDAAQALSAPVRLVCKVALTADDPVGTIGMIDGREAMVVDLGGSMGKYAIALRNEGATSENDYGTYYEGDDSYKAFKSGSWCLPSKEELEAFYNINKNYMTFVTSGSSKGVALTFGNNQLFLPYGGYVDEYGRLSDTGSLFGCWSSTETSYTSSDHGSHHTYFMYYVLTLSSSTKGIERYDHICKMNVRLFHKL